MKENIFLYVTERLGSPYLTFPLGAYFMGKINGLEGTIDMLLYLVLGFFMFASGLFYMEKKKGD